MLSYEDELLHAVAIYGIPVALQLFVPFQSLLQFPLWHGGEPLAYIFKGYLLAGLLEEVAHVAFSVEVADAFGSDYSLRPASCHKVVELVDVERLTVEIDVCADAILFGFAFVMVVVVMVVVFMFMLVFVLLVVVLFLVVLMVVVMV